MNRFGFVEIPDETEKTADGELRFFDASGAPIDRPSS
jgi:hypothetical protein